MTTAPGTAAERLPRGRHGLTREEVTRAQRERILRALAESMAEKGYVATSVADVLRVAGVSRETFYQQFSSKQDCFMSAYEAAVETLLAGISAAAGDDRAPDDRMARLRRAFGAYLEGLAAEPALARLFLLEVYAAGPDALERRAKAQARFVELVTRAFHARGAEERFACEALVAATSSMVTTRLAADDLDGLRALEAPLADLAGRILARRPA
jgi:AcrR family transcriptional regulator